MTRKEKANFVIDTLEAIYPVVPVPLDHTDPYTLLIAVLLSAQSTDVRVNQITPKLFKKADTPGKMVLLETDEIREIIKPVGLSPAKSKAIKGLSEILMRDYDGTVPQNLEELEKLPGVGHKTASVVVSQAFGIPAFPVDTHIHRLLYRWGLSSGKNVVQTERDAKKIFPQELWNKLHLQIIFYGREFCPSRGWNLEKDIITSTIGRKSIINAHQKQKLPKR